jgi:hypothetical protein
MRKIIQTARCSAVDGDAFAWSKQRLTALARGSDFERFVKATRIRSITRSHNLVGKIRVNKIRTPRNLYGYHAPRQFSHVRI